MMGTEMILETSVLYIHLSRLKAWENFIELIIIFASLAKLHNFCRWNSVVKYSENQPINCYSKQNKICVEICLVALRRWIMQKDCSHDIFIMRLFNARNAMWRFFSAPTPNSNFLGKLLLDPEFWMNKCKMCFVSLRHFSAVCSLWVELLSSKLTNSWVTDLRVVYSILLVSVATYSTVT